MASPVCNVQGLVQAPQQKLASVQPVPPATDLPSALKAIQALTNNLNNAQNQANQPTPEPTEPTVSLGNFSEDKSFRTTSTVRIFNPSDNTQYVDVVQITQLVFKDPDGRSIVWKL